MVCFSPDAKPAATRSAQPRCVPSGIVSPRPSVKLSPIATYRVTSFPLPRLGPGARLPNGCVREGTVVIQIARSREPRRRAGLHGQLDPAAGLLADRRQPVEREPADAQRLVVVDPGLATHRPAAETEVDEFALVPVRVGVRQLGEDTGQPLGDDVHGGFLVHLADHRLGRLLARVHHAGDQRPLAVVGAPGEQQTPVVVEDHRADPGQQQAARSEIGAEASDVRRHRHNGQDSAIRRSTDGSPRRPGGRTRPDRDRRRWAAESAWWRRPRRTRAGRRPSPRACRRRRARRCRTAAAVLAGARRRLGRTRPGRRPPTRAGGWLSLARPWLPVSGAWLPLAPWLSRAGPWLPLAPWLPRAGPWLPLAPWRCGRGPG